ncbi:hypothetical protein Ddye_001777 [Dipteronia dyeriana]|uniref:DUF4218 domain-containing protein n=1 Tax=Dipteronia dyeriana TaxID=168575 RepID=A0AAD9XQI2_9ROSI|nr:hypothetical protein Ddye_001777 [Dipteronia dyeriana]
MAPGRRLSIFTMVDSSGDDTSDTNCEGKKRKGRGVTRGLKSRQNFQLHAAVIWTINDFPAYGDLSGWSTKGYMACPVCNEYTSSRKLRSKICYMGHRRFLPMNHPWRWSRKYNGDTEHRKTPTMRKGEAIVQQLQYVRNVKFGKNVNNPDRKRKHSPNELNWTKKICAKTLNVQDLKKLEEGIVLILCKLEKKFPPSFFDVMVHLVVHLPYEAKLVGPVGYSWMYLIESKHYRQLQQESNLNLIERHQKEFAKWFAQLTYRDVPEIEEEVEEQEEIVKTKILDIEEEEDLEDHQFHREDVEAQTLDPDVVFSNQNDEIDDIDNVNEDETLIYYNNDDEEMVQNNDDSDIDV